MPKFGTKKTLFGYFWVRKLQTFAKKQKYLNLGLKVS